MKGAYQGKPALLAANSLFVRHYVTKFDLPIGRLGKWVVSRVVVLGLVDALFGEYSIWNDCRRKNGFK